MARAFPKGKLSTPANQAVYRTTDGSRLNTHNQLQAEEEFELEYRNKVLYKSV